MAQHLNQTTMHCTVICMLSKIYVTCVSALSVPVVQSSMWQSRLLECCLLSLCCKYENGPNIVTWVGSRRVLPLPICSPTISCQSSLTTRQAHLNPHIPCLCHMWKGTSVLQPKARLCCNLRYVFAATHLQTSVSLATYHWHAYLQAHAAGPATAQDSMCSSSCNPTRDAAHTVGTLGQAVEHIQRLFTRQVYRLDQVSTV